MSSNFTMLVSSIFYMRGHGIVLAGRIDSGSIAIGDRVAILSPRAAKRAVVAGLERVGTKELLTDATEGQEIAILCRDVQIEEIADGVERGDDGGWKVVNLSVSSAEDSTKPWWSRLW
jgi:translation elongation factor EF-Tu-like GTPase